jgi:hypothetical protein
MFQKKKKKIDSDKCNQQISFVYFVTRVCVKVILHNFFFFYSFKVILINQNKFILVLILLGFSNFKFQLYNQMQMRNNPRLNKA